MNSRIRLSLLVCAIVGLLVSTTVLAEPRRAGLLPANPLSVDDREVSQPLGRWIWTKEPEIPKNADRTLARMRLAQQQRSWAECARLGSQAKESDLRVQALIVHAALVCATREPKATLEREIESLLRRAETVGADSPGVDSGGAVSSVAWRSAIVQARLRLAEATLKERPARALAQLEWVESRMDGVEPVFRALLWRVWGELAVQQQRLEFARVLFRRSLAEQDQVEVRQRLAQIERPSSAVDRPGSGAVAGVVPTAGDVGPNEEEDLLQRMARASAGGETLSAIEDGVRYISRFPGAPRAKGVADRIGELYVQLIDRAEDRRDLRERALRAMGEAESERVVEWVRLAFVRGQFEDTVQLVRSAATKGEGSRSGRLLELGMEAAFAIDRDREGFEWANRLLAEHPGSSHAQEALLRSSLAAFRKGQHSVAIVNLERFLLPQRGSGRLAISQEIIARYWYWRSLQAAGNERAASAAAELIRVAPFSYYGLRAQIEMNNGTLPEFTPKQAPLKVDFWVTPRERRAVERARRLARAGWLEEAQSELRALPKPDSPEQAALLAGLFAQVGGYTSAFRLMNEAWDAMRELRREPFLRWVFPEEFQALIQSWSAQRRLNPEVVRSLMKQESAFSPQAVSVAPAYGLMQIIVPTGREIASEIGLKDLAWPDALMDPQRNVQMGTHYLAKLLNKYKGHVPLALAAYNAGPTRVDRYLRGRPALAELMTRPGSSPLDEIWFDELPIEETSIYIKSILRNMIIYRALRGERTGWAPILWQTPSVEQGS